MPRGWLLFQGRGDGRLDLRDDVVAEAAAAGLRSLFVGFETLSQTGLASAHKRQKSAAAMPRRSASWTTWGS